MVQSSRLSSRLAVLALGLILPLSAAQAETILYDQNGPPSGNGIPDQNFETGFNQFDSEAADDFEVTAEHGWDIHLIRTVGTTDGDGPGKVNVRFFANSPGGGRNDLPGAVLCSYDLLTTTSYPNLEVALPTPCHLPPGRFWLGVQVEMEYALHGQHFWSNTRNQSGNEAVWRNPLDGFDRGCPDYQPQTMCLVGGANNPDLIFQIVGENTPPPSTDVVLDLQGELAPGSIFVRYDLTLTNNGPLDATGVAVSHSLPEGCRFERDSCGGELSGDWRWNLGNLANGATVSCDLLCDAGALPGGETLIATATAVANQPFTNPAMASDQVELITGSPPDIPVGGPAGLALLATLLALVGTFFVHRF